MDHCLLGMTRSRKTDDPYLMAGVTALVGPVMGLTSEFGLRSDEVHPRPSYVTISLSAPEAEEQVGSFFLNDAWPPDAARHLYQGHARQAEEQLAQPDAGREPPWVFPEAAGWRVVLQTGSPVDPARQAVEKLRSWGDADDEVAFYQDLIEASEAGGQPAALAYLQQQRAATLAG